ncbi:uncharacterized protein [Mytilus edulis]|uniref:uncharacterized protein n=1 Tax=Mytilus edulis TaxID=6550 RepID=UPI0039EEF210
MVSKEEDNFLRIVYLHYRVATEALTNFFDKLHPSLSADLNIPGNKAILRDLYIPPPRKKRVLYRGQWDTLYPPPGTTAVTSADLDLTLIVCLLRSIPPLLTAPLTGFDNLPPYHDQSDGANIARLKYYKNFLVSHSKDGKLPTSDFERIWSELEQAIKGIDNSHATAVSLKDAETKMLDNSMAQLLSTQLQLVTKVSNFEEELQHISIHIDRDVQEKRQLKQIADTLDERMKIKEDSFEREYKECKENIDMLSRQLNTSEVQMYERIESIETYLEELQNLQHSLDLQFTRIKTIAIQSKKEKEVFEKDVQLVCSRIQVDITNHEERIAALENKSGTLHEIKRAVDSLKRKLELIEAEMKKQDEDHIPKHIRAHHRQEIKEWEQDETTFVKTRATRHILKYLTSNNSIVVTGSSGCGKSSNIHHAALHLRDSFGYKIIPVLTGPTDIINYYNENKKQVFIVDDICGKETINTHLLQMWLDYSEGMEKIFRIAGKSIENKTDDNVSMISGPKLMISCRLHVYKESQLQFLTLLSRNECNILSKDLCLLQDERILMAHMYLTDDMTSNLNVIKVMEEVDFFPLLCKLATNKSSEEVIKLFTAPVDCITQNINHIVLRNKEQFCALVLCILFDNGFDTDWLNLKSAQVMNDKKLLEIVKAFNKDLSNEMSRNALKIGFNTLSGTYLKQRGTEYRMIHDKVHDMAAVVCGQHLIECFIKYSPSVFIRDHFIFESLTRVVRNTHLIVILKDQEENYFDRLLCDLKCNVITSTFHNKQLEYQLFMDKLLSFFGRSDDAKTVLKDLDTKGCITQNDVDQLEYPSYSHLQTTPLIESATRGYIDIVHFLVNTVRCNVNKTDGLGQSPLYKSSKRGHSDMVKLLLEINADVIQFNDHKESPLDAACKGGYTDVVKLLMQNNTNVSWCNDYQESPLYVACERGHTDIGELLLQNNACVSQCNFEEESPLFVASKGGYTDTVALLLKNNADISQCNSRGESPLFVACKGGHTDTVDFLIKNHADVSQCNFEEESSLFVACKEGHKETVALLLQNYSCVSQCNCVDESPLYVACEGGHTDIVEMLLQSNADVSQCNRCAESPLYVACAAGHTDTVDFLLHNNADINQCDDRDNSPLFVACEGGHTDTVDFLLHNNANVSQCNKFGQSPMFVACEGGHTNTVKVLLQNNADVNQCNYRVESSLFIACAGGHTDTVEFLLQNNADLSQCDYLGNSPLYVACASGHEDTVELLLKKNADVSKCNKMGMSPLYVACKFRCRDTVKLLLQKNADVSQCEQQDGKSPLHVACKLRIPDISEPIGKFWDPNVKWSSRFRRHDDHKLDYTYEGYFETIKLLIAWNADVGLCDKEGQTPLDYARKSQSTRLVKLLEKSHQIQASNLK